MTGVEKVCELLGRAKPFYVLTTDGDQPKGRPFGLFIPFDGKVYFGCGTFKNVFKQLTANPKIEILAYDGADFMRYDGIATVTKDAAVAQKFLETAPGIMDFYAKNGWEMGMFYLENGHAEIRGMMDVKEEFDV